jgi:predicted molibdopterin-dependent oxidoreductase YjgC
LHTDDVDTHCGFCSLGCRIKVRKFGDGRYFIGPSGEPGDYLCRYGRFGHELFIKRSRITDAQVREGSAVRTVDICDAYGKIVDGMRAEIERNGAGKVAVFVSPELTSEELYIAGLIAREGLGTGNIASLSILGTGRKAGSIDASLGFTASTSNRGCLTGADLIICNNTSLESDHLVLAADVIESVRNGADFIVSNSTLDTTDRILTTLTMDPMRGRGAALWNGVIRSMLENGLIDKTGIEGIPGADEFLGKSDQRSELTEQLTGVSGERIDRAAGIIAKAKRVVVIHSPDRMQDNAPGDLETLANLVVILRSSGIEAELLLPRIFSNSSGLEVTGADPAFSAGRNPVSGDLPGASNREELLEMLERGELVSALIIGEDPLAWRPTDSWFANVKCLAAMDWTPTETTRFADVVLPGSTYLETEGTRCNFEGGVVNFSRAVNPPSGLSGREVLEGLAQEFGIDIPDDISGRIERLAKKSLGESAAYYWNTGEIRKETGIAGLQKTDMSLRSGVIPPPLTHGGRYKKEIREVGTGRFRVHE